MSESKRNPGSMNKRIDILVNNQTADGSGGFVCNFVKFGDTLWANHTSRNGRVENTDGHKESIVFSDFIVRYTSRTAPIIEMKPLDFKIKYNRKFYIPTSPALDLLDDMRYLKITTVAGDFEAAGDVRNG